MLPNLGTTHSGRFLDTFPWQQHSPTFSPHHFVNSSLDGGLGMKLHMNSVTIYENIVPPVRSCFELLVST